MATFTPPFRNLRSCERGPEDLRPILGVPRQPEATSSLQLRFAHGVESTVQLAARRTAVVLALVDAWHAGDGELEALRGFLTADELGQHYARFSHTSAVISKETVRAYIHDIRDLVGKEVSSLFLPRKRLHIRVPRLIEGRRVLGYRIGPSGLEIVQARSRRAPGD